MSPASRRHIASTIGRAHLTIIALAICALGACQSRSQQPASGQSPPAGDGEMQANEAGETATAEAVADTANAWRHLSLGKAKEWQVAASGGWKLGYYLAGTAREDDQLIAWLVTFGGDEPTHMETFPKRKFTAVAVAPDGTLTVGGASYASSAAGRAWLATYTPGRGLAERGLAAPESSEVASIRSYPGGTLVTGVYSPASSEGSRGWVVSLDGEWTPRLQLQVGDEAANFLSAAVPLPNDRILAAGGRKDTTFNPWTVHIGADGQIEKEDRRSTPRWESIRKVAPVSDGAFLVGLSTDELGAMATGSVIIERVDVNGARVWAAEFGAQVAAIDSVTATAQGVAMLVATRAQVDSAGALHVVYVDGDGKQALWAPIEAAKAMLTWTSVGGSLISVDADLRAKVIVLELAEGGVAWRPVEIEPTAAAARTEPLRAR